MSKNIAVFENKNVEVFEWNGVVLFNPYHVGACLDLTASAVRNHLQNMNDKQVVKIKKSDVLNEDNLVIPTSGRVFLTESGVYKLIFKSRKKEAEKFADWVTDEVLPSIRKTGQYTPTKPKPKQKSMLYKTYQGRPVLIMRDFVDMLEVAHVSINQMCIRHNVPRILLNGDEVRAFKKENPGQFHPSLSNIAVFPEEATRQLMQLYGIPFGDMSIYFEVSSTPPLVPVAPPVDSPVPSLRLKIETAEELLRTAKELLDTCV